MNRYVRPAARAGATAVAAATGLMVLASTGQTPSGFVPASFGGPLGLFDSSSAAAMADVVNIGDGPTDANELATLLKTAGPITSSTSEPLQATFTPGAVPNTAELNVAPSAGPVSAPVNKQAAGLKPVLDNHGNVDCSRAVSCQTDPVTHVTTVTYPDGVVAIVQQLTDMTLVAYKTVGQAIQDGVGSLLQLPKTPVALPAEVQVPTPVPVVAAPAAEPAADPTPQVNARHDSASVETGPAAPSAPTAPDITASTVRPRLTITNPPTDFGPDRAGPPSGGTVPQLPAGTLGVLKDAVDSMVSAVTGGGNTFSPGAGGSATKSGNTGSGR